MERRCIVSVNEGYSRDEVLLNFDNVGGDIKPGALMCITVLKDDVRKPSAGHSALKKQGQDQNGGSKEVSIAQGNAESTGRQYVFRAKEMSQDMRTRQPDVEVYVVKHIADSFGLKKGTPVLLTMVRIASLPWLANIDTAYRSMPAIPS